MGSGNRLLIQFSAVVLLSSSVLFGFELPSHCKYNEECLIEVKGMLCADDTPSYITLTARKNAEHALIFLNGGGACWSKGSCNSGFALKLTHADPNNDWEGGTGIQNASDEANPFRENYNIIHVPYCTGDVFTGNKKTNYGTESRPYVINHHGYENVLLAMDKAKSLLGTPKKVVFLGQSAGGIGVYYHLHNLNRFFPDSRKYVISDAGTPFKPPHLPQKSYDLLLNVWGAKSTLPPQVAEHAQPQNFGEIIDYNTTVYPDIHFGLIQSYNDYTMTFFAQQLSASDFFNTVKKTMIDVADHYMKNKGNSKVYFIDHYQHVFTSSALHGTTSLGVSLDSWMQGMLDEKEGWQNVRPDLSGNLQINAEWMKLNFPM